MKRKADENQQVRIQRGDRGSGPPPPENHVTWVSIGNKQLDPPPPPRKRWTPPGKCWTPSGTLKNDSFLRNKPFDFSKISWGLKKTVVRAFFYQIDLDPPPPPPDENSWIRAWPIYTGLKIVDTSRRKATARSLCHRLGVTARWPPDVRTILRALHGHRAATLRRPCGYPTTSARVYDQFLAKTTI